MSRRNKLEGTLETTVQAKFQTNTRKRFNMNTTTNEDERNTDWKLYTSTSNDETAALSKAL